MEGELDLWQGIVVGWKNKFFILQENILYYCQKKGEQIEGKIHMKVSTVKQLEDKEKIFKIFTGIQEFQLRAKNSSIKRQWLNSMKISQESNSQEEQKIKAIKALLNQREYRSNIDEEIQNLLKEEQVNILKDQLALLNDNEARLKEQLSNFSDIATPQQQKYIKTIMELGDNTKKQIYKCLRIIESEKDKLLVISEVFRKKIPREQYKANFQEQSFTIALEKLLTEYNNEKPIKEEVELEEQSEESIYKSFLDEQEFNKAQQSFFNKMIKETPEKIEKIQIDIKLNSQIEKLINNNEVFLKFPVLKDFPEIRVRMPVLRDPNVSLNVWTILKENLGKDLSRITMPIYFNEPFSMLQKAVQFMEYQDLLVKANQTEDKGLQCAYLLSSFIIIYCNTVHTTKKPFNPLLGETYEIYDKQNNIRLLTEQVSHHPPIAAIHSESDDYIVEGYFYMKSDFSLKGFIIYPLGKTQITLKKSGDIFELTKPNTSVHNFIIGKLFIWTFGDCYCENMKTGHKATLYLKPKGWTTSSDYEAEGKITDEKNNILYHLYGKWNSYINAIVPSTSEEICLVKKKESPEKLSEQYYFSKWGINANHLTFEMIHQLPPTDCRFRPDQRAYEYGDMKLAADFKHLLEENQRKRRKIQEESQENYVPKWFDFLMEKKQVLKCQFNGEYWKRRESQQWPEDLIDLYNQFRIFDKQIAIILKLNLIC